MALQLEISVKSISFSNVQWLCSTLFYQNKSPTGNLAAECPSGFSSIQDLLESVCGLVVRTHTNCINDDGGSKFSLSCEALIQSCHTPISFARFC